MLKTILISELKPGMYVQGVVKQQGSVKVKSEGWVRTQAAINKLAKSGILEVSVDPDKFIGLNAEKNSDSSENAIETPKFDPTKATASFSSEANKAKKLYTEAKQLQSKAFDDIRAGRKIDVAPFKQVASGFIDSVFRNQDALACMTRIREKDAYLLEHSINVSVLMSIFAKHMGFEREVIHELATGALLHDIGKIKVPDAILNKPGKLTDAEFDEIKRHALYSKEILEESELSDIAIQVAGFHHERLDGKGYPFGLKDDEINQYVRMISIVDVYDALTAKRVYKDDMNPIQAFKILRAGCPSAFDSDLVARFIQCIGIHPVGTLVKLKSQKLGIVSQSNFEQPLKPTVKVFYSAKHQHYTEVQDLNLASNRIDDELESSIKPEDFGIDLIKFFRNAFFD
ncbi:HD-GYP domain-containing protein [Pseudoalteromonas spongiae]|uniref:HD-GYP domain-containing protein n=1 Tax=Pseudoalteromonas spongiae TaxID=298657 RepID=UPI003734ED1F